ncbi:MAG: TetR/AcrR family transcriptional regulator [Bacteroidales bacterium]
MSSMNEEFKFIIEKVSALYLQYGIKSVTMDDVARELGISKKTLYKYVENKIELVSHFVDYILGQRLCTVQEIQKEKHNAIEELFKVNEYVIEMLRNYNPSMEYDLRKYYPQQYEKVRKHRRTNMYQAVLANIQKGKKEGLFRSELNEDIISRVHVSRIENSFANEMFSIEELTSKEFITEMMEYHIRGIASKKGIEFFENKVKEFKK